MHRTLPLEDVARRTGQPVERLREWCATGLLPCDRVDGEWALPETELATAQALAATRPRLATSRLADGARVLVAAFRDLAAARRALDAIRARIGAHSGDVELAPVSIDGMQRVLVAGRVPGGEAASIDEIVTEAGGQLVEGGDGQAGSTSGQPNRPFSATGNLRA